MPPNDLWQPARCPNRINAPLGTKTISEMAALYDVSLRTLRFYEEKGLISPDIIGTIRYYSARDEIRLQFVQKGKKIGFSLSAIEELMSSSSRSKERSVLLSLSKEQIVYQIDRLESDRAALTGALEELYEAQKKLKI